METKYTEENIHKAFTEWERQYLEAPEIFNSNTEETYAEACTRFFMELIEYIADDA